MEDKNILMARKVAERVKEQGGRTYYVGGFVRDRLMGIECKDVDIEVHGIEPKTLTEILDSLGEHTEMGASFGIYGLRHYDLDIAMPRQEYAVGKGHKDFEVFTDPYLGTEKAARRRDFTVNAMMENVLTGEIVDHFGGRADLQNKVLRHVDDRSFGEDPLRVLRGAQFAARFDFSVAEETVKLCSKMELSALPAERIIGELNKALEKAQRPSVFFAVLERMSRLEPWFLEYAHLSPEKQNKTRLLLDKAAAARDNAKCPGYFMLAALCCCMDDAEKLIDRLTNETKLREYVLNMLSLADRPAELHRGDAEDLKWNILFDSSVCPDDLLLLSNLVSSFDEAKARQKLASFRELMCCPCVMGRDLIEAGLRPDRRFSEYLSYAHNLHLAGLPKHEALEKTFEYVNDQA